MVHVTIYEMSLRGRIGEKACWRMQEIIFDVVVSMKASFRFFEGVPDPVI